jgi:hypothetical protein
LTALAHGGANKEDGQHNTLKGRRKRLELLLYDQKTPKKIKKPRKKKNK